jgi:hypothetical protein
MSCETAGQLVFLTYLILRMIMTMVLRKGARFVCVKLLRICINVMILSQVIM